jgi:group I intron endonuclease
MQLMKGIHHSRPLQNSWNKHGADVFEWIILEIVPLDQLIEREQIWMDHFQVCDRRYGYNIAPKAGSVRGVVRSQETKAKIALSHIGIKPNEEARAKMRAAAKSRVFSEETRARMSAAGKATFRGYNKGKVMSLEQRKKIGAAGVGRRHTEETRKKMSLAKAGKPRAPEHVAKSAAALRASGNASSANIKRWASMTPERRAEIGRNISVGRKAKAEERAAT